MTSAIIRARPGHTNSDARLRAGARLLTWAVWATLLAVIYREVTGNASIMFIGSYNLTIVEPVLVIVLVAFLYNARIWGFRSGIYTAMVFVFISILLMNLLIGFVSSPMAALASLRATGVLAVFLLIGILGEGSPRLSPIFERAVLPIGLSLCVLVALRLGFGPQLFMRAKEVDVMSINDGGRPLSAFGALVLNAPIVLLLSKIMRERRPWLSLDGLLLGVLAASLLITGQGTASICALAGISIVMALQVGRSRRLRLLLLATIVVMLGIAVVLAPALVDVSSWSSVLPDTVVQNLLRRESNHETRLLAWTGILNAYSGASEWQKFFGWSAGTAPYVDIVSRQWGRVVWTNSAHSMYFGTLITHGLVGLLCLSAIFLARIASLTTKVIGDVVQATYMTPHLALIIIVAIFGYSYDLRNEGGLMLAVALAGMPIGRSHIPRRPAQLATPGRERSAAAPARGSLD